MAKKTANRDKKEPSAKKTQSYVSNDKEVNVGRELIRNGGQIEKTSAYGTDIVGIQRKAVGTPPTHNDYQREKQRQDELIIRLYEKGNRRETGLQEVIKAVWPDLTDIWGNVDKKRYGKCEKYVRELLALPKEDSDRWLG